MPCWHSWIGPGKLIGLDPHGPRNPLAPLASMLHQSVDSGGGRGDLYPHVGARTTGPAHTIFLGSTNVQAHTKVINIPLSNQTK